MGPRVKFVHAADLHLGAPFAGIVAEDDRVRRALVDAPYRALAAIVELCISEKVDFLVLAGDVYNAAERGVRPQLELADAVRALGEAGTRVFIAHGNHDPAREARAFVRLPGSAHVFSHERVERVEFERDGEVLCALYGRSFGKRAETGNLAASFRREEGDRLAIGVLHANVGGRAGYDDYAPCSVHDLAAAGMDYWALGHIHEPGAVSSSPLAVYAGAPQGMDPTQTGERGCYLVSAEPGEVTAEFVPVAGMIWDASAVDVSDAETLDEVEDAVAAACRNAAQRWGRAVCMRVTLTGRSEAHAVLAADDALRLLVERVREQALAHDPWVWLDRVDDRTGPPIDIDVVRAGSDLAADIVRIADELSSDEAAVRADVEEAISQLRPKLARAGVAIDVASLARCVVERARDRVLDILLAEEAR